MRFFKIVIIGVVVVLAALVVVGFMLPRYVSVTESQAMKAEPETIFPLINNFSEFNRWSPWAKYDPNTQYTFAGPNDGVGHSMTWVSDNKKVGSGRQEIIESIPHQRIRTKLDFGDMGLATAVFELTPTYIEGMAGTTVSWGFDADMGKNPMARYFGFMLKGGVRKHYQEGLRNLKTTAERAEQQRPVVTATRNHEFTQVDVMPVNVLFISDEGDLRAPQDVIKKYQVAYEKIFAIMARNQLEASGPPLGMTTSWQPDHNHYAFDVAVPIGDASVDTLPDGMGQRRTEGGLAIRATHHGPYETLSETYDALQRHVANHGLTITGNSWEEYLNDPNEVPPDELMTYVYFPIA